MDRPLGPPPTLPCYQRPPDGAWIPVPTPVPLRLVIRSTLLNALAFTDGHQQRAARALGLSARAMGRAMITYDIPGGRPTVGEPRRGHHEKRMRAQQARRQRLPATGTGPRPSNLGRLVMLLLVLLAAPVYAQGVPDLGASATSATNAFDGLFTPRLVLPAPDRRYADWTSTGLVAASVLKDFYDVWKAPNRKDALIRFTIRDGSAAALAEVLKRLAHRRRPDGSDDQSWPSEHTMFAILLAAQCGGGGPGPGFSLSIPLVVGTGLGRITAGKHFASDVLSGAGIGWLIGHYTRGPCH